jgi:predicted nucleic acid-binding Zn ribbon protein
MTTTMLDNKEVHNATLEQWQKLVLLSIYKDYDKIIGPYFTKNENYTKNNRMIITFYNSHLPKNDLRKSKTFVYARAVAESYLGEQLPRNISVDHINRNYLDNRPENLALITMNTHAENDNMRVRIKPINCPLCSTVFEPTAKQAYPQLDIEGKPGPFCPTCVRTNAYMNYINKGGKPLPRVKLEREYYKIDKNYNDELLTNIVLQRMAKKGYDKFVIPDITKIKFKCCVCGTNMDQPNLYCSNSCKEIHINQQATQQRFSIEKPSKEVLEEHLKKMNFKTIADKYRVLPASVVGWARAYGIEYDHHQVKHNGRSAKLNLDVLKGLMKAGYNYKQIGDTLGISRNIIENTVRRKNLREEVFGHDRTKWPINNWQGGDMTKIDAILVELNQKYNK